MRKEEWRKIQANFGKLVSELDLENTGTVDYLYEKGALSEHDKDRLNKERLTRDKNRLLLETLEKKDDDAYGHFLDALKVNQPHICDWLQPPGIQRKRRSTPGKGLQPRKTLKDFTVQELKEWILPILEKEKIETTILDKIEEEKISGRVFASMSEKDLIEVFQELKAFGHRRTLMLAKTEASEAVTETAGSKQTKPSFQRTEFPREFGHEPQVSEKYHEGKILKVHEAGSKNLIAPVRCFCPCLEAETYTFIADKVAIFAAACLNDRANGTIYFGISDQEDSDHDYGQVLGLPLDKKDCEDAIRQAIRRRFCGDPNKEAAVKCIKPAVFVDVVPADTAETENLFVCEVDVEPKSSVVKDYDFFLKNEQDSAPVLYRLEDGVPVKKDAQHMVKFSDDKAELTHERQQQEKAATTSGTINLIHTLKNYLCGGGDKLDGNFFPMFATSAVDTSHPDFQDNFSFLWNLDWRCIFDFHPASDESGLYHFMDTKKEMLYKVKRLSDFVETSPAAKQPVQSNPEENFQDMADSELKPWIFCNGYTEADEKGLDIAAWKKERSMGFRAAVKFFKDCIPDGRAVVIILLTSKDDVFIEASEEILLNFEHQWLMVSESKQLADQWMDGLHKRNVIFEKERCLCGIPFADVCRAVEQLQGNEVFTESACVVRLPSGLDKELPKKLVQELCDLDIVSANQCAFIQSHTEKEISLKSQEEGDEFYRGNPATFWNFYFQSHVCQRDKYADLLKFSFETLKGDVPDNASVGCVAVYHQPGAGGTTIAMNVLWGLHKDFKCCVVKRITNETARQVVTLYEFAETCTPVLLMLDNEDDDKIDHLQRNIEEECQNKGTDGLVCVFLLCSRRVTLPQEHQYKNIVLRHNLSTREKQFFLDKYDELKKSGKSNLDSLLGLNIMKENFNEAYIRKTVSSFLEEFQHARESTLLQYVALLNCYDIAFRAIPTSCFDPVMPPFSGRGGRSWENMLTPQPLLKFTRNVKLSGKNKCLKISNKLLCRYILDISLAGEKSIGELMEEFLNSPVLQRNVQDFAYRELVNIVRDIMKKREWVEQGRRSMFSPFIQMLYDDKDYSQAVTCMEHVFQQTYDPVVAQQLARFHISRKKWREAEQWAEQATMVWPTNSYLWDTHGQICRFRLSEIREDCEAAHDSPDMGKIVETVKISRTGFETFGKVHELSMREKSIPPNTAGLFGQMDIALLVLKIFKYMPSLKSADQLQNFFYGDYMPPELNVRELRDDIPWLKSVLKIASDCLRSVEDMAETYAGEGYGQTSAKIFLSGNNLKRYKHQFSIAFGREDLTTADPQAMAPDARRRLIRNLGGYSLYSVMSLYREPEGKDAVANILFLSSLNLKQQKNQHSPFDLNLALASALTLCSRHDTAERKHVDFRDLLRWSSKLYQLKLREESQYIDLDPVLFLLVFHWPNLVDQSLPEQCDAGTLYKGAALAAERFKKKFSADSTSQKKNTPLYFLTQSPGTSKVVSRDQLHAWSGRDSRQSLVKRLLQSKKVVELLQRFSGILTKNGNEVEMKLDGEKLRIPLFVRESSPMLWNKKVFFVLGFGLGGPLACDVRADRPSPNQDYQPERQRGGITAFVPCGPPVMQYEEQMDGIRRRIWVLLDIQRKPRRTPNEEMALQELPRLQSRMRQLQQERHMAMLPDI